MLRFLRQYMKQLLVVFGTLLMVVFLLPAGGSWMAPSPMSTEIGRFPDRKITSRDRQRAAFELEVLRRSIGSGSQGMPILFHLARTGGVDPQLAQHFMFSGMGQNALSWIMIQQLAKNEGIYVSEASIGLDLQNMQQEGLDLQSVLGGLANDPQIVADAVRHWRMFEKLQTRLNGGGQVGESRLRHMARDFGSTVKVRHIAVDADYLLAEAGDPSTEEITAQFEKHKADAPGTSEPHGFGYRLPARVKLEYLQLSMEQVAASIQVDEVEARRWYLEHPERYFPPKKEEKPAEAKPEDAATPPAEKPVEPDPAQPIKPLDYLEVRSRVLEEVKASRSQEAARRIEQWIQARLSQETATLVRDDKGYFKTEGLQPVAFESLAQEVQQKFGVLPAVVKLDRWTSIRDLLKEKGFGQATLDLFGRPVPLASCLMSLREVQDKDQEPPLAAQIHAQVGIASPGLLDSDKNRYFYRVLEAHAAKVPESIDEVKDPVVRDLRRQKAFELLKPQAAALLERAKKEPFAKLADALKSKVEEPPSFRRFSTPFPDALTDAVFTAAESVREAGMMDKLGKENETAPAEAFSSAADERSMKLYLLEVREYQPIDRQTYGNLKGMFARSMERPVLAPLFDQKNLKKLTRFESTASAEDPDSEDIN